MQNTIDICKDNDWDKIPIIENKPKADKEIKYMREMIQCEFSNLEEPGLSIKFVYGDTRNSKKIQLFHGGKYRVPRFIQRHIESKTTPIWAWRPDGQGGMQKSMTGSKSRFQMREVYSG